jgi:SNF2 family DNA or RNA helicase
MSFIPYKHQLTAAAQLAERSAFGLLMEMGTGKTRTLVLDLEYKLERGLIKNFLLVAPSGSYRNWDGELEKWLPPELYKKLKIFTWVSSKTKPKDFEAFLKMSPERPRVLLMNVEALSRVDRAKEGIVTFLQSADTMWCIDESQCIKAPDSLRTKFILKIAPLAKYRRILTGLVAPENPLNVYSQFAFLNPDILGHRNFFTFRARYAVTKKVDFKKQGGRPVEVIVGYRNVEELQKKIADHSFRVRTEEVLDLPPKIYMPIRHVDMTMEQLKAYNDIKRLAMTEINGQYVTAQIAAAVLTKLHSILCGHVVDENGEAHDVPSNRVASLLELLEDYDGKAIIWAPYPRFLKKIAEALEKEYGAESTVRFWGEVKSDDREIAKARFQEDPKCRFFVSNQSVGGEGNTLTAAHLVVYAANSWKNSERQQSEARAHRIGQNSSVTYVDLAVRGSMEEKLIKALRNKMDLAALVSGDKLQEWLI